MWEHIKAFFASSETIFWARLNTLLGLVVAAITYVDPSLVATILPPQWVGVFLLVNGIATEYLRRRRTDL